MLSKKLNLLFTILLLFPLMGFAQTLATPDFKELPCYGQNGLTHPVELYPVAGADGYIWYSPGGTSLSINGMLPPVTTTIPNANITYIQPDSIWKLCVYAFSSCCTSFSNCQFIYNAVPLTFWPSNSATAYPNTTDIYGIYFNCLPLISPVTIYWVLTGGITFSNGQQSITSGSSTLNQTLIFGPGFNSGTLCVYTVNSSGVSSSSICLSIVNPTGFPESNELETFLYYNSSEHAIFLKENKFSGMESLTLYDSTGRIIYQKSLNYLPEKAFRLPHSLNRGLYTVHLTGKPQNVSGKILIQ